MVYEAEFMEKQKSSIVLSVIVSTYNRSRLVCKNLRRMLKCKSENIEFIVGDNASEDDTLEQLHKIEDSRLRIFHNEVNYGMPNILLLSYNALGKYFIFVNDRDYIKAEDLDELCAKLAVIKNCDFISTAHMPKLKEGYYKGWIIPTIFLRSRHPGTLIYSTQFFRQSVNRKVLEKKIKNGEVTLRVPFEVLCNAKRVYVSSKYIINQPRNREQIPQLRKEVWGGVYILPQTRIEEYGAFVQESRNWTRYPMIKFFLLAKYVDSLRTVMQEYYSCLKKKGFTERYYCAEYKPYEWAKNGVVFAKNILFEENGLDGKIRWVMLLVTPIIYIESTYYVFRTWWNSR